MRKNSNPNKDKKNDDAQTPMGGEKLCLEKIFISRVTSIKFKI